MPINKNIKSFEKTKNFIKNSLEYSSLIKKYASNEYQNNPNNFIDIDSTINNVASISKNFDSNENEEFLLSIIGKCIENNGTKVYVTKNKDNNFKNIELASIQSLFSLCSQKKYEIHFDFGMEKNNKILNDPLEQKEFISKYSSKLSQLLNLNIENLILTDIHPGSVGTYCSIIGPSKEVEKSILKLKGKESITKINQKPLLECLQISKDILDSEGDRKEGWGVNEKRGNEKYIPPLNGWEGIGLKVRYMYDNGNNDWLDYRNIEGEFAVAYIGINNHLNDKNLMIKDLNDYSRNISKMISEKLYQNELNLRNEEKCGEGICLFQNPLYAESSAGIIDIYGIRIKVILMCRVNPEKIRQPKNFPECWILNPTPDEIRPYRILIKKIPISPLVGTSNDTIITNKKPIKYIISAIKSNDLKFYNLNNDIKFKNISTINGKKSKNFAIRLYSTYYYRIINEYLRTKQILNENDYYGFKDFDEKKLNSWICCLQNEIFKLKNVQDDSTVYRGIRKFKFSKEVEIGTKFYFREFLSTSTSKEFSINWINGNGTLMIITIKNNGTNGYKNYCCYIEDITLSKNQYEVLFASHCYFIVTKIERKEDIDYIYLTCMGYLLDKKK